MVNWGTARVSITQHRYSVLQNNEVEIVAAQLKTIHPFLRIRSLIYFPVNYKWQTSNLIAFS